MPDRETRFPETETPFRTTEPPFRDTEIPFPDRKRGSETRTWFPTLETLVFEAALALPQVTHNAQLLAVIVPGLESALEETGKRRASADDVRSDPDSRSR